MGLRGLVGDRREDEGRRRHKLPFVLLFWVVGIESSGWSLVHRLLDSVRSQAALSSRKIS